MVKAVVLIDGEHYPPVVEEALTEISQNYDIQSLVFLGGTEKIGTEIPSDMHGYRLIVEEDMFSGLKKALSRDRIQAVIDLSDEPVIGYEERLMLANLALAEGVCYKGADFEFTPPKQEKIATVPSISIIGTGKRIGKTAISAHICRVLKKQDLDPVVVAMGRGGPKQPDILKGSEIELSTDYLIAMSEKGMHAASDYYEDALMSRITTVGCRRCGGGLAGMPFISNVEDGAYITNGLDAGIVVFEGSGSSMPPVFSDKTILCISATQKAEYVSGYFGPFRVLKSDLVMLTNCEEPGATREKIDLMTDIIQRLKPGIQVMETIFRPKPLQNIEGMKVFVATTSPPYIVDKISRYIEENYGCSVIGVSTNLSNRKKLREDLNSCGNEADVFLTELKAAAVDVVAKIGVEKGKEIVFYDNEPILINGKLDLEEEIKNFADKAITAYNS